MKLKALIAFLLLAATVNAQKVIPQTSNQIATQALELPQGQYRIVVNVDTNEQYLAIGTGSGSTYRAIGSPESVAPQSVDIEAGYFTKTGTVKVGYYDESTDAYKDLYGMLIHPIRLTDREFLPNVVVTAIAAGGGAGGKDRITFTPLDKPVSLNVAAHGFTGTLYVDEDGELTSIPPTDTYRQVEVGQVIDTDNIVLHPGVGTQIAQPVSKSYDATVWSHFKTYAFKSATLDGGTAEIVRGNVPINGTPNSIALLSAINDPSNADEIRFSSDNTGIFIEFETQSYVSDLVLQIPRRIYWTTTYGGGGIRTDFDVEVYTLAADGSPAQTIVVWDGIAATPDFNGMNTVVPVNQQCEKIKLSWSSTSGAIALQGSIQSLIVRGKKRKETITISPGSAKVPYDGWKLDSPIILRSERIDTYEHARSGISENTNLLYPTYAWGWGRSWNPGTDTGSTVDRTIVDRRSYRDWVYDGNFGKYNDEYQWLSIDHESTEWQYHPADTSQQIADRDASWRDTYDAVRALSPGQFTGPYLFPFTAFTALQGYFRSADPNAHGYFANAKLREINANKLYELSDVMTPVAYRDNGESMEDWKCNVQHRVDECHQRGKLCIPYLGAMNRGAVAYWGESDYREMLRYVLEQADGVMLWEQITAYETTDGVPSGSNPYTPTVIESICRVVREEVERIQSADEVSNYRHLEIAAGDLTPDVTGYTSAATNGSGDTLTDLDGGTHGQIVIVEIASGDELDFGTGTIDAGTHGTPPSDPLVGPAVITLRYGSDDVWHRLYYED